VERKPSHLGRTYAEQFAESEVVRAYVHRVPYPQAAVDAVAAAIPASGARALDIGCGSGDWTLALASTGARIDAVDASEAMLAAARERNGNAPGGVRWLHGPVESVALDPPYDVVTAAESLHWMEWTIVLPRIASVLRPGGELVILGRTRTAQPWADGMLALIQAHSTNRDYAPYDLIAELTQRGLFRETRRIDTPVEVVQQSVNDYVEAFHSRNGFSRARMSAASADAFDRDLEALVRAYVGDGPVEIGAACRLVFGTPAPAARLGA